MVKLDSISRSFFWVKIQKKLIQYVIHHPPRFFEKKTSQKTSGKKKNEKNTNTSHRLNMWFTTNSVGPFGPSLSCFYRSNHPVTNRSARVNNLQASTTFEPQNHLVGGWTTHSKNISQIGSFPQVGIKIKIFELTPPSHGYAWKGFSALDILALIT